MKKITYLILVMVYLHSCIPARKLYYFHNQKSDTLALNKAIQSDTLKIKAGDRLTITVSVPDPLQSSLLNPINNTNLQSGNASSGQQQGRGGYLVRNDGTIDFPVLGTVVVKGLTTKDLQKVIQSKLEFLYKDPYVNVNIEGRVYFVSGRGGNVIPFVNERLTVFEALAQVENVDAFDRRHDLWIIREDDNKREMVQLDLNDKKIFESPYYYMQNNDLLYLKPGRFFGTFSANSPARFILTLSSIAISITLLLRSL